MSNKKWVTVVFLVLFVNMSLIAMVNYVVDPFGIFGSNILKNKLQMNERFVKIEYIEKNHQKYNAYLFGSSRIGVVNPKLIEQYVPNSKFYNFTVSSANLYDYLMHLRYFVEKNYELKTLYLQLDIDDMNNYGQESSDYLSQLHPHVTHDSTAFFYARYLLGFFPLNIRTKIEVNLAKTLNKTYDLKKGTWQLPYKEKALMQNAKEYVEKEKSFHLKSRKVISYTQEEQNNKALTEIVEICKEKRIKLYVFTTPHNHNMTDTFFSNEYKKYLSDISKITTYYDFSGYNSVTRNNENYYEVSHYRPHVGRWIAAKIFHDKSVKIPKDFGKLIKKGMIHGN